MWFHLSLLWVGVLVCKLPPGAGGASRKDCREQGQRAVNKMKNNVQKFFFSVTRFKLFVQFYTASSVHYTSCTRVWLEQTDLQRTSCVFFSLLLHFFWVLPEGLSPPETAFKAQPTTRIKHTNTVYIKNIQTHIHTHTWVHTVFSVRHTPTLLLTREIKRLQNSLAQCVFLYVLNDVAWVGQHVVDQPLSSEFTSCKFSFQLMYVCN